MLPFSKTLAVLFLAVAAASLPTAPVFAQSSKAVEVCAKTALQQAMLLRSVVAQSDWRDAKGRIVGAKVDLDVNALGKKKKVSCYYTDATRTAVIREYKEGGSGDLAPLRRDAVRACQKASQQQGLMLDQVVSQADMSNRKGQIIGSEVVIGVYQSGKPMQVVCEYTYDDRSTALELRRPTLR
jgi:hypothetical protein